MAMLYNTANLIHNIILMAMAYPNSLVGFSGCATHGTGAKYARADDREETLWRSEMGVLHHARQLARGILPWSANCNFGNGRQISASPGTGSLYTILGRISPRHLQLVRHAFPDISAESRRLLSRPQAAVLRRHAAGDQRGGHRSYACTRRGSGIRQEPALSSVVPYL
jgi:hypothetical protein